MRPITTTTRPLGRSAPHPLPLPLLLAREMASRSSIAALLRRCSAAEREFLPSSASAPFSSGTVAATVPAASPARSVLKVSLLVSPSGEEMAQSATGGPVRGYHALPASASSEALPALRGSRATFSSSKATTHMGSELQKLRGKIAFHAKLHRALLLVAYPVVGYLAFMIYTQTCEIERLTKKRLSDGSGKLASSRLAEAPELHRSRRLASRVKKFAVTGPVTAVTGRTVPDRTPPHSPPAQLSFSSGEKPPPAAQPPRAPGSRAAANRPGSRRRGSRLHTPANRSGLTGFRSVLAVTARPRVVHCDRVSKEVREYFQRDLERAKKLTAQRAQEKLRKEKAAAEGNYPGGDEAYDEEAELQRALNQSRAEEEFRRGVQQRGGAYEHGGGSGTRGEGTLQRMLRRATSARQTPGVTDYNLGSARGSTQPRIDTGSWTQKGKRKYHIAPSKVIPKRQRGQATGKGKQKEIEVLSDEDTDDGEGDKSPEYQESQDSSSGDDGDDNNDGDAMMVVAVVAVVAVLLAVAGAEACHLQTHLLDIDHGAPMSQRRTVGPTDYDSPQFSSSSSYRESSHGKPPKTDCTGDLNSKFEFNRFPPVTGQTGPVNRYRRAATTVSSRAPRRRTRRPQHGYSARLPQATVHPDPVWGTHAGVSAGVFRAKLSSPPSNRSAAAPNRSCPPQIHTNSLEPARRPSRTNSPEPTRRPPRTLVVEMSTPARARKLKTAGVGCGGGCPSPYPRLRRPQLGCDSFQPWWQLGCGAPFSRSWRRAIRTAPPILCVATFCRTWPRRLHQFCSDTDGLSWLPQLCNMYGWISFPQLFC
ncbi:hypothetical protein HU200_046742 [Digitaria exilis]|uniref:Transmembrane protein n=1 Tax=Digitaria exilis TaxID=1010633 RepID=A0A835B9L7_9POAL|nr:hypothetical protein HU200_046742 [Digitaria exilis]